MSKLSHWNFGLTVKILGTSKNAVHADRIMKFIDENELNYI